PAGPARPRSPRPPLFPYTTLFRSAMYPHRIRLRGPWQCEPIDGPPPRRVIVPCGWIEAGLAGFHGLARFTRRFGYPGNVDDTEQIGRAHVSTPLTSGTAMPSSV